MSGNGSILTFRKPRQKLIRHLDPDLRTLTDRAHRLWSQSGLFATREKRGSSLRGRLVRRKTPSFRGGWQWLFGNRPTCSILGAHFFQVWPMFVSMKPWFCFQLQTLLDSTGLKSINRLCRKYAFLGWWLVNGK